MRLLFILLLVSLSIVSTGQERPIIVVELFTSEGCSGCPPVDRLLSSIVNAADEDAEVLGLSFHVDYWDYIGWQDPYASQAFTLRQRAYARKFGLRTIYTPQMIVNGKHEFVGSSQQEWNRALSQESNSIQTVEIEVSKLSRTSTSVSFFVKSRNRTDSQINVAIVEKNLSQDVKRGENSGRKLMHDNVVRAFATRHFDGKENKFTLDIPQDLKIKDASLIIYAQAGDTWKISAAKLISLATISE